MPDQTMPAREVLIAALHKEYHPFREDSEEMMDFLQERLTTAGYTILPTAEVEALRAAADPAILQRAKGGLDNALQNVLAENGYGVPMDECLRLVDQFFALIEAGKAQP